MNRAIHIANFADLKRIIGEAKSEIFIVDPYFNGSAFDEYLSAGAAVTKVKILADAYTADVVTYAGKHSAQFKTAIEIRRSKEPHDRVIFVDGTDCWISGGSIKDGGKKPTYLIPVHPEIAAAKRKIYEDVWSRAAQVFESK